MLPLDKVIVVSVPDAAVVLASRQMLNAGGGFATAPLIEPIGTLANTPEIVVVITVTVKPLLTTAPEMVAMGTTAFVPEMVAIGTVTVKPLLTTAPLIDAIGTVTFKPLAGYTPPEIPPRVTKVY